MPKRDRIFQRRLQSLNAIALLLFIAVFAAGCGGGSTPSTVGTPGSTSSSAAAVTTLKADAGAVCETLVTGVNYTKAPPTLSCNNGSDPYTAYLDGSKSTGPAGQNLSYAWSFVSRPTGSNAQLSGNNTATPTFVPDKAGSYTVQLVVSAQGMTSPRAVALVVALDDAALNPDLTVNPSATAYHFHGGLSNNCSACHSGSYADLLTKPSTHIATTNNCQACHSPLGFNTTPFVDHGEVVGKCSDCHDGVTAIGKSAFHQQTTQECSDCHNTTKFVELPLNQDGSYDHSSVTEPCSACHNGTVAIDTSSDPNPKGHPSITVECNSCHSTATFSAPFVNHSTVMPGTCGQSGCHANGTTYPDVNGKLITVTSEATAKNPHINTSNSIACDLCHNTTSYNMGGVYDHSVLGQLPSDGINVSCFTCHDGVNATGEPGPNATPPHTTRTDCESCHTTVGFLPAITQDHTGFDQNTDCFTGCHNGTDAMGMPTDSVHNSATNPDFIAGSDTYCGRCHTPPGGTFHTATIDHSVSKFGSLGSPLVDCTSCHDGSITTAQGKPSYHIATSDNCGNCHSPQAPSFAGAIYDHSGVTVTLGIPSTSSPNTCVSCHDGSTAKTVQSVTHVPMTAASGTDCVVCHDKGPGFNSSVADFSTFKMDVFDHATAGVTANCISCHDGKTHDTTLVITKPSTHIPTSGADCSTCHTNTTNGPNINGTSTSGFTNADPFVNTVHPAYSTGCHNCHNSTYDNTVYKARSHPADSVHNTVDANGWECNACHSTTGGFLETNPVNHQDPTIKTQACISCHDGNTPGAQAKGATHPSTADTCQDCHQAGGSFTAAFDHTTLDAGGVNYGKYACTDCHDGVNATGKPQNHVSTTQDCISCHAGHPPTVANFANGTFAHTGAEMNGRLCMDCHDGTILGALGKDAKLDHVVTSADCSACHTTDAFKPATSVDHTNVTSGCQASGCHAENTANVVDVTDDPNRTHIPIVDPNVTNGSQEVDCINCHKNPGGTFANAVMNHTVVAFKNCEDCHGKNLDGANTAHLVTAPSSNHIKNQTGSTNTISTISSCATCHQSTSDWTQVKYTHRSKTKSPAGYYPGNHNTSLVSTCTQCHNDSPPDYLISSFDKPVANGVSRSQYYPYCAGCHGTKGENRHGTPLSSKYINCGDCHSVGATQFTD